MDNSSLNCWLSKSQRHENLFKFSEKINDLYCRTGIRVSTDKTKFIVPIRVYQIWGTDRQNYKKINLEDPNFNTSYVDFSGGECEGRDICGKEYGGRDASNDTVQLVKITFNVH